MHSVENEWYTPKYIFDAMGYRFDMDVAAAPDPSLTHVPADKFISTDSLSKKWEGFIWCNPPWAGRGQKAPWVAGNALHDNGLLLTPDRSSAGWWQYAATKSASILFVNGKIKFIPGPGNTSNWKQPGTGTTIFAFGMKGVMALATAEANGLGIVMKKARK